MRIIKTIVLFLVLTLPCFAQSQEDINRATYARIQGVVAPLVDGPSPALLLGIAKAFEGTEYVASTLEVEPESLQIFMDKTDCILFVEMCVALTMTYKGLEIVQGAPPRAAEPSYELFCTNIRSLRYRSGVVDGYASRLHYTSEWIHQGEVNGLFHEITSEMGDPRKQNFSFMSKHPDSYKQLKGHPDVVRRIQSIEHDLDGCGPYYFISQKQLQDGRPIKDGDILAFVSTVDGLDVTHVAIACSVDGEMHFIHASTKAMKVIVESQTLAAYAKNGVRVIRLC